MDVRSIRSQVRGYAWPSIVRDAIANGLEFASEYTPDEYENENVELDDAGQVVRVIGSSYLGSVLPLSPSGKYYTPWANSNVDLCSHCHGSGEGKLVGCKPCQSIGIRSYAEIARQTGEMVDVAHARILQMWPDVARDDDTFLCISCHGSGQTHETCSYCGGLGSREAYEDQIWYEALDECATRYGGSIENGEGDPTDVFFTLWIDVKREAAKQTVKRFVKRSATFGELKTASRDL